MPRLAQSRHCNQFTIFETTVILAVTIRGWSGLHRGGPAGLATGWRWAGNSVMLACNDHAGR